MSQTKLKQADKAFRKINKFDLPSEHAVKTKIDLQLSRWTHWPSRCMSSVYCLISLIDSLNRAAGSVCSPVFSLDKNCSVMTADSSSSLSRWNISREIRQDNAKQRSVVQRKRELIRAVQPGRKPHDALQHVIRGVVSVITQS